jgi:curved DNA-binding protein CbpA
MRAVEHYEELGVPPSASTAEIRASYLALARQFHPDHLADATAPERERATARMARINAAWSVLSDRQRRATYDATWRDDPPAGATVRDPGQTWSVYDDEDDPIDPRLLDDTPTGAASMRKGLTFLPASLGAAGSLALLLGFLVGIAPLLAIGLVLFGLAALSFLVIPLIALSQSSRADRES